MMVSRERVFLRDLYLPEKWYRSFCRIANASAKFARKRRVQATNRMRGDISLPVYRNADSTSREKLSDRTVLRIFRNVNLHFSRSRNVRRYRKLLNFKFPIQPERYICPPHRNSVTPSSKNVTECTCSSRTSMSQQDIGLVLVANLNKSAPMFWQLARARARASLGSESGI